MFPDLPMHYVLILICAGFCLLFTACFFATAVGLAAMNKNLVTVITKIKTDKGV